MVALDPDCEENYPAYMCLTCFRIYSEENEARDCCNKCTCGNMLDDAGKYTCPKHRWEAVGCES